MSSRILAQCSMFFPQKRAYGTVTPENFEKVPKQGLPQSCPRRLHESEGIIEQVLRQSCTPRLHNAMPGGGAASSTATLITRMGTIIGQFERRAWKNAVPYMCSPIFVISTVAIGVSEEPGSDPAHDDHVACCSWL